MIWFNVKEARDHLVKKGFVYTLRPKVRKSGVDLAVYWDGGIRVIGKVFIRFIGEIRNDWELKRFIWGSGFRNVEEWRRWASDSKYLYYVSLLKDAGRHANLEEE